MKALVYSLFAIVSIVQIHVAAYGGEPKLLPRKLLEKGWIQLFDGETLFGWRPVGDAKWEVKDGEIRTDGAKPGFLMSTTEWSDYELHVEFRAPAGTNSGVFLRTALEPTDPTKDCYELNIAPPDNPFPTGSLVGLQRTTRVLPDEAAGPDWHTFDVEATPDNLVVHLDGRPDVMYRDPPIRIGHIGLQAKEGRIAFRHIRVRPIGPRPLLNGRDLSGWTTADVGESKFNIAKGGVLQLTNGPGQLATEEAYKDFVLRLECKVNGDGLNSGIFFRALRDGRWAGYESQINNAFVDGDRTKPKDFGTGGIYRRQPARRVVANDGEWLFKTIVADGPHMAVWVNGYQVSDWTDTRPEKENAREGLRLKPGVIAIQGHDPTTNFWFRNFRVAELPQ